MLIVRLAEAIEDYKHRSGKQLTREDLAKKLRMATSTLRNIATPGRSTTLHTIEKIARALEMKALNLLAEVPDRDPHASDSTHKASVPRRPGALKTEKKSG